MFAPDGRDGTSALGPSVYKALVTCEGVGRPEWNVCQGTNRPVHDGREDFTWSTCDFRNDVTRSARTLQGQRQTFSGIYVRFLDLRECFTVFAPPSLFLRPHFGTFWTIFALALYFFIAPSHLHSLSLPYLRNYRSLSSFCLYYFSYFFHTHPLENAPDPPPKFQGTLGYFFCKVLRQPSTCCQ